MSVPYFTHVMQAEPGVDVRAIYDGDAVWFSAVDLFKLVLESVSPQTWPQPFRVTANVLIANWPYPTADIVRPFGSFGITAKGEGKTGQYIRENASVLFLRLSGMTRPASSVTGLVEHMIARVKASGEAETPDEGEDDADKFRFNKRLVQTQKQVSLLVDEIKRLNGVISTLERDLRFALHRISEVENAQSHPSRSETSEELRKHAARLYARSKQLETEGR